MLLPKLPEKLKRKLRNLSLGVTVPQQPLPHEKRRHLRLDHNIPLKISSDHGDILTETKNLSCSGAFCRMNQRLEPMTKLKVHLLLPLRKSAKVTTKKITCQGVVVLIRSGGNYLRLMDKL